jgi:hypothetical protein
MDIRLCGIRHVIINDTGDTVDINAGRGNIGNDENVEDTVLETVQRVLAIAGEMVGRFYRIISKTLQRGTQVHTVRK